MKLQKNNGINLVIFYIFLYYIAPLVGNYFFSDYIYTIYKYENIGSNAIIFFVLTVFFFLVIITNVKYKNYNNSSGSLMKIFIVKFGVFYSRIRFKFSIFCLFISLPYIALGMNSYRYTSDTITESSTIYGLTIILINIIVTYDSFYQIFINNTTNTGQKSYLKSKLTNINFSAILIITANGTGTMVLALISLAFVLFPSKTREMIFYKNTDSIILRLKTFVISIFIMLCLASGAWMAGETIKAASNKTNVGLIDSAQYIRTLLIESPEIIEGFGYYLISAMSSHLQTFAYVSNSENMYIDGKKFFALEFPMNSALYRLDYITGRNFDLEKPIFSTISRLNYVLLSDEAVISERQGTSPGLFGSFIYAFPLFIASLICSVYMAWISNIVNKILNKRSDLYLTTFGLIIMMQYVLVLFQSPLDFLIIFDNAVLIALIIVFLAFGAEETKKNS
jgi:hypothetical protein